MTLWQGVVLGLVQGLTEFLPVSSSGHLALVEALTGVKTPGVFVEVMLHVATLGSVLLVYGRRLGRIALGALRGQPEELRYVGYLVIGTIPAVNLRSDSHPTLSHDGRWCAFTSELENQTSRILLWDMQAKQLVELPVLNDSPYSQQHAAISGDGAKRTASSASARELLIKAGSGHGFSWAA